jgi:hypothetical protein
MGASKIMISPQEPSRGGMSNEEYARVMTGQKYWREHISEEILHKHEMLCTGNNCLCKVIATQVRRG